MVDPTDVATREPAPAPPTVTAPATAMAIGVAVVVLAGALPFFIATTFFGDDHVFLAFSRYATNPLIAFVRDQHGGEYYRPLPMLLWWALGRIARGASWPFAALALLLHLTVAIEVAALLRAVRRDRRTAAIAAALFFAAPFTRDAAYWYAASTDLLATAFGVGAVVALLHGHGRISVLLLAGACWSKESAIVVPVVCLLMLRAREPQTTWSVALKRVSGLAAVAALYLVARSLVLRGAGGAGDQAAPLAKKLMQVGAGLIHAAPGWDVLPEGAAWTAGTAFWIALGIRTVRMARTPRRPPLLFTPWSWVALTLAPVLAAPEIVGTRYFYLAAVGIAWLAAESLRSSSTVALVGMIAALGGLDVSQTIARRADVVSYQQRLIAARRAVASGLAEGYTTFHIASGIKDLDLAVKEDPRLSRYESELVVLTNVPASFVAVPEARAAELDFLLARPPLPPAGAYRFGERRIVGLARREEDPGLDEVLARLPAIRFIRLRLAPGGSVVARDETDAIRGGLPAQD